MQGRDVCETLAMLHKKKPHREPRPETIVIQ